MRLGAERADGVVRLCVADEGPGWPRTTRPRVFDTLLSGRAHGGAGSDTVLGLAIRVRREGVVRAHGGEVPCGRRPRARDVADVRVTLTRSASPYKSHVTKPPDRAVTSQIQVQPRTAGTRP
ncbi:hypothetical protein GCM10017687_30930 [Streptomyces echinatus]|uniref:ATP-binding protein n=1 Tax=Streptomyces echinatus TaxID=67293 RepID=UPI0031F0EC2E